ncbi:MAG: CBS domain-containing protein [Aestuariivirga sp.]|uniref:CBS domain-containing protein n=1 Tax=Aestuariivirga sp. TaxID=2650926 RepID=UPI00301745BE
MTVTSILMNKHLPLVSVSPTARVESVIELMKKNGAGSVVVVGDCGQFEGMITERDIFKAIDTRLSVVQSLLAKDIMSSRVETCTVDDSEASLMERMVETGVQHLPVVSGGEVIAVVSIGDLVEVRVRKIRTMLQEIEDVLHIEKHLEYFTRNLKPFMLLNSPSALKQNSSLPREQRQAG